MSTILSESALEKALHVALELLKKAAKALLKKAAEALERHAGPLARKLLAFALEKLGHKAEELSRKAARLETAVGREVAKVAQAIADELYEMARKLKESLGKVELEQETPASESSETELFAATYAEEEESVKSAIEEVERLLTELVKLKGHEVVDDHSYKEKVYHKVKSAKLSQEYQQLLYKKVKADRDYFMNAWQAKAYELVDERYHHTSINKNTRQENRKQGSGNSPTGKVELEQETQASESSEAELFAATYAEEEESVKSAIEEVERLLTELVKLKGHEVVDDHSYEQCSADISTISVGLAALMDAFLLACGTKGKRFCMPTSRVMTYDPSTTWKGRRKCKEKVYHKVKSARLSQEYQELLYEKVEADTDRDYFMNAWQAKAYELVDEVELEQETPASESSEAELFAATYAEEEESVKSAIEEVERLLTELVKLKGHEVVSHGKKLFKEAK
nr:ATP-dependent Clp protease proteolytic subunit 3, chloroplastic [Tanacetum cinerariifolium]